VPLPGLFDVDQPLPEDLPLVVERLIAAIERALDAPPLPALAPQVLEPFTRKAVFDRVEAVWQQLARGKGV
jgi:hypothetical protein